MLDQILVPLDGSLLAKNILPHTMAMAKAYGSEITLISVLDPLTEGMPAQPVNLWDWQIKRGEAEAHMNEISAIIQENGLQVQTAIIEGRPADRIVEYTANNGTNLIMLSSHGKGGISEWNNGSVVTKIFQQARTSVMVIRSYTPPMEIAADLSYRRILAPLDGSRRAEYGLFAAAHLARKHGAKLHIAHIVKPPELPRRTPLSFEDQTIVDRAINSNLAAASKYLDAMKASLDCEVEISLLADESVAEALHTLVEVEGIDLVVLNAHGLSGNSGRPFGSLTLNFLTYSTTALLIVQDYSHNQYLETKAETFAHEYLGQPARLPNEPRPNYKNISMRSG